MSFFQDRMFYFDQPVPKPDRIYRIKVTWSAVGYQIWIDGEQMKLEGSDTFPFEMARKPSSRCVGNSSHLVNSTFESLIHASGIIRSDKDRVLIIGGYTPTMFQAWNRYDPNMEFADTLTEEHRSLLTGDRKFNWQRRERNLGEPAGAV